MISVKDVLELAKKGLTMELQQELMAANEKELALREENLALKENIALLQRQLGVERSVVFERGIYWVKNDLGKDGPFCQRCYDSAKRLIRLQSCISNGVRFWNCLDCHCTYE